MTIEVKAMTIEAKAKTKDFGSEAKTKDLSFKAKAKAGNCRPRGALRSRPRPRGLHLWIVRSHSLIILVVIG